MNSRNVSVPYGTTRRKQYQKGRTREGYEFTGHKDILGESVWKWQVFRTIFCQWSRILNPAILSLQLANQRIGTIRFAQKVSGGMAQYAF